MSRTEVLQGQLHEQAIQQFKSRPTDGELGNLGEDAFLDIGFIV